MPIPIFLFLGSLAAITVMIGRKLPKYEDMVNVSAKQQIEFPYLKEAKEAAIFSIKKHGYTGLVATLRIYIRGTNLIKYKYIEIEAKLKNTLKKKQGTLPEKKEVSKFLKTALEYKEKLRELKHRIKKEESL